MENVERNIDAINISDVLSIRRILIYTKATFREILLPSLGNVNDYVAHVQPETIEFEDLSEENLHNAANSRN